MRKTRRDFLKTVGATAAGTGALLAGGRVTHAADPQLKWKAQTLWSAAELTYKVFQDFCARVKKLTNGRLEITPLPAGAVVGNFECLDALSKNVLQAMNQWPGYWTGKDPAFASTDLIFGYSHPWQADAWYHYKGGLQMLRDLYAPYNAYCVGVTWWGVESIPSKKPLHKLEDFKGIKFRVPQGMTADLISRLGGSTTIVPGGEVYSALERGVVDATDWGTPSMNHRMGFHEVTKYFNYPGFHSMPVGDFTVNLDAWKALPDDIKTILEAAVREYNWDQVERVAIDDIRAMGEMKKKGVTPITWSDQELRRIRAVAEKIWDEWAAKGPASKKMIESQKAWLKDIGQI